MRMKLSGLPLCKAGDWGLQTPNRFHLYCVLLTHKKERTQLRATALHAVGCIVFSTSSNTTPPEWGACGNQVPAHTCTGDTPLRVATPRKHSFCCLFLRLRRKKRQQKGDLWGCAPSTGVTCGGLCLRTAKHARKSVPAHSGGVFAFFDFVEKRKHPTPKGSVREPGSLTHPQVTPIEGCAPMGNVRELHAHGAGSPTPCA